MLILFWPGLAAFALTLLLTPLLREAIRPRVKYPVPHAGGLAIALAFLAATLIAPTPQIMALLPGASVILAVGLIDDLFELKPRQKLIGQLLGISIACGSGIFLPGWDAWYAFPVAMIWLLACTNAFNLVDGVDGLATGLGLIASLAIFTGLLLTGQTGPAFALLPLPAALAAFLFFNFPPASVFLGDSGSLLLGYLLGSFALFWNDGPAAPLVLALPLLEVALTVVRRLAARQPLFTADRGHMHHRLLAFGFTPRHTALRLYGAGAVAAVLAVFASLFENPAATAAVAFVACLAAAAGIRFLRCQEFEIYARNRRNSLPRRDAGLRAKL